MEGLCYRELRIVGSRLLLIPMLSLARLSYVGGFAGVLRLEMARNKHKIRKIVFGIRMGDTSLRCQWLVSPSPIVKAEASEE